MHRLLFATFLSIILPAQAMASFPWGCNRFYIGVDSLYRDYSEKLEAPLKSDEYGNLYGVSIAYDRFEPYGLHIGVDFSLVTGAVTYDGTLVNLIDFSVRAAEGRTRSTIASTEARVGYTLPCNCQSFTPFFGVGYHYWYRGKVEGVPRDYSEAYDWSYFALGLHWEAEMDEDWTIACRLKCMYPIQPEMSASDVESDFELGSEWHFEAEFPISRISPCDFYCVSGVRVVPYYRYLSIGASDLTEGYIEPDSNTHVVGLRLELIILN